jgi:hypothetical protein
MPITQSHSTVHSRYKKKRPAWELPRNKNFFFGSNRNKPKLNLFRFIFGLFRETNNNFFRFVSVFRTYFETTEINRSVSKQTEKKKYKRNKKAALQTVRKNCLKKKITVLSNYKFSQYTKKRFLNSRLPEPETDSPMRSFFGPPDPDPWIFFTKPLKKNLNTLSILTVWYSRIL